jgi:general stress protein 26
MDINLNNPAAVQKALWRQAERCKAGMMFVAHPSLRHARPMTPFAEAKYRKLWFYARKSSELGKLAEVAQPATFVIVAANHEFRASIVGLLHATEDEAHRDAYWNGDVAMWFPDGKTDPDLTMLCLICQEAEIWVTDAASPKFGWEVSKPYVSGPEHKLGGHVFTDLGD